MSCCRRPRVGTCLLSTMCNESEHCCPVSTMECPQGHVVCWHPEGIWGTEFLFNCQEAMLDLRRNLSSNHLILLIRRQRFNFCWELSARDGPEIANLCSPALSVGGPASPRSCCWRPGGQPRQPLGHVPGPLSPFSFLCLPSSADSSGKAEAYPVSKDI